MKQPLKILYLEDEEIIINVVRSLLQSEGISPQITTVQTKEEYLSALQSNKFDFVLADYALPDFNGLEALKLLRRNDKHLPFILFSGSIGEEKALESLRLGATDYVLKQNIKTLLPAIRKAVDEYKAKKKSEKKLQTLSKNETKFRLLAEYAGDWEYLYHPKNGYVYVSPACERVTGYAPKDFKADRHLFLKLVDPDYVDKIRNHFQIETGQEELPTPIEFPIRTRDGKKIWIEHHCTPVYDSRGEFIGRRANNRDISQRKQFELTQQFMLRISTAALQKNDELAFYQTLVTELNHLIDTSNFYIGIYNEKTETLSFPFMRDENDHFTDVPIINTISRFVITEKKSVLLQGEQVNAFIKEKGIRPIGAPAKCWLGVPLLIDKEVIGLITVQNYSDPDAYNESDKYLLEFVANEIAALIKRQEMEKRIYQLSRSVDQSPVSTVITDLKGTIQYVNPRFCQLTGYSYEEAIGQNPKILKSGETPKEKYKELWDTITRGKVWKGRFHNRRKNGQLFWEDATIGPIKDNKGRITNFVAVKEDVTDIVKKEQEFRRLHRYNELLNDSFPAALIVMDQDEKIIRWNQKAEELFGMSWEEVKNKHLIQLPLTWSWDQVSMGIYDCRVDKKTVHLKDMPYEKEKDVHGFLDIVIKFLKNEEEQIEGFFIVCEDVTRQKIIENQQVHAQKLESIGQLAAGIAHEINTPAQYVSDNIHFLEDAFGDMMKLMTVFREMQQKAAEHAELANLLQKAVKIAEEIDLEFLTDEIPAALSQSMDGITKVSKIVRAMKEFSHPGTKSKTLINLNRAIENTATVCRNEWKYVAELETDFDASLSEVPCYHDEFNQVILNMIINAAHAIGKEPLNEQKKGQIRIVTRKEDGQALVSISDNGSGIPPNIIDKIFDPFFTTKEVGKGTGQGLAIAHDVIVNKHGGTIDVESEPGKGTTFTLRIPLEE